MHLIAQRPEWIARLDEWHLLTALRIVLVLLSAIVGSIFIRIVVRRVLSRAIGLTPGAALRGRAEARQRSLASALRGAAVGVVWATAAIVVVSELGVDIGAFVASATVVGGAIAFGAQTLIRDFIAGLYVLAEDQYGEGDDIDLGHAEGRVERLTLRSVRIRDAQGVIWYVPHGGVVRAANRSQATAAVLDIEVARTTALAALDAEAVDLCRGLHEHPSAQPLLAGTPQPVGIVHILDDRFVFRLAAATRAGTRDEVVRLWKRLLAESFEAGRLEPPPVTR